MSLRGRIQDAVVDLVLAPAFARACRATDPGPHPLPDPPVFRPLRRSGRFGVVHYNLLVPDLPAPHRFLATMVILGQAGTRVFDADHAVAGSPRNTATVALGTAATAPQWFRSYSIAGECELRDDGSLLRFGDEVELRGTFPELELCARLPDFALDLKVRCTDEVTWFMRSWFYDHVGLPARYTGILEWQGDRQAVSGLCSFEHAQSISALSLADRVVPTALKLPVDFFTYQVLAIDARTLLLLTHVGFAGRPLLTSAFVKEIGGEQLSWFDGIACDVLDAGDGAALVAPDGRRTPHPRACRWRVGDPDRDGFALELVTDTAFIYGLGSGWIGGASYRGRFRGRDIAGSAYYEHADRRGRPSVPSTWATGSPCRRPVPGVRNARGKEESPT